MKNQVDTPYEGSWAHQEFLKKNKPIYQTDWQGRKELVGYEPIPQTGHHPEFGKRSLMPNEKHAITLKTFYSEEKWENIRIGYNK